jgi:hypothetical protein
VPIGTFMSAPGSGVYLAAAAAGAAVVVRAAVVSETTSTPTRRRAWSWRSKKLPLRRRRQVPVK